MAFYKTAKANIMGVYETSKNFIKSASNKNTANEEEQIVKEVANLLSRETLDAVAKVYNLSENPSNYVYAIARACSANVPNNNGDCFKHEELIRFSPAHRCQVYQTFRNDPLHIEHAADDPKAARGFLPDAYYMTAKKEDMHVLTVVAVDTKKDPALAEGMMNGEVDSFSMGCICESVKCSVCNKVAHSDKDLCDHLRWYKMSTINGKLVYEDCLGVEYQELSVVGNPADPTAKTQALLKYASRQASMNNVKSAITVISTLLDSADQVEVARYFSANAGKLPVSMMRLADKLF